MWAVGGAQSVALLAFGGTDTDGAALAPVDMITGPGNIYVTAAKRICRSQVGIDAEAGPTEIAILADHTADPVHVAADMISQALVNRLKTRSWGNRAWNVRLGQAGSATDADIVISGQVQEFSAGAKSRAFSTVIDAKSRLTIQAKNAEDKSTTTRSIEGARSRTVFWFGEQDVQELLAATLDDGIERLIADTMVVQKAVRPAR